MKLVIKKAVVAQLDAIYSIEIDSHSKPWTKQGLLDSITGKDKSKFWCACDANRHFMVVGYICFRLLFDEIYILKLTVEKGSRRQGVGSTLLNFLKRFAEIKAVKRIVLDVQRQNGNAISFYSKHGFKPACDFQRFVSPEFIMELELPKLT